MKNIVKHLKTRYEMEKKPNDTFLWFLWRIFIGKIPFYAKYRAYERGEHKKRFGKKNEELTFYIIRAGGNAPGLMSLYNYVVRHIHYALINNYIPIIDFKYYPNMYLYSNQVGKINSWEYWFCQPQEQYSLAEIRKSKNVIISGVSSGSYGSRSELLTKEYVETYHNIIKNYIKFNPITEKHLLETHKNLFGEKKILGVKARGTDYVSLSPKSHSIVPEKEELSSIVDDIMESEKYEFLYLATEDEEIYTYFKNKYKDKLIVNQENRYDSNTGNKEIGQIFRKQKVDLKQEGLDYLTSVYLLSKCDSLITPVVGAGVVAILMNGNRYKRLYIFDKGVY